MFAVFFLSLLLPVSALRLDAGHVASSTNASSGIEAAKQPLPIPKQVAWLHIRKSGTSFVNALLHHEDLCPRWPRDVSLTNGSAKLFWHEHPISELCPEGFSRTFESPPGCAGIGRTFELNAGRVMGMFRKPEQRHISEFYMQTQDPVKKLKYSLAGGKASPAFMNKFQGCITKTLTRQANFSLPRWLNLSNDEWPVEPCLTGESPTQAEVKLAVERVGQMAFVGLTSHWALSICLFHAMYGGRCKIEEMINTRPGPNSLRLYDEDSVLGSWKDPYDTPVYLAARESFWRRIKEWGVKADVCERSCWKW